VKDDGEGTVEQNPDKGRTRRPTVAKIAIPTRGTVEPSAGWPAAIRWRAALRGIGAGLAPPPAVRFSPAAPT